jgi:hypothetical protein
LLNLQQKVDIIRGLEEVYGKPDGQGPQQDIPMGTALRELDKVMKGLGYKRPAYHIAKRLVDDAGYQFARADRGTCGVASRAVVSPDLAYRLETVEMYLAKSRSGTWPAWVTHRESTRA